MGTTVIVFTLFYAWEASMPINTFRDNIRDQPTRTFLSSIPRTPYRDCLRQFTLESISNWNQPT